MSKIITNVTNIFGVSIPAIKRVRYDYMRNKVYSADKVQKMYGVFVSNLIDGDASLVTWDEMSFLLEKHQGMDVKVYLRANAEKDLVSDSIWSGPYLNSDNNISSIKDRFIQFMVVLSSEEQTGIITSPSFKKMRLSYFSSANAVRFYTKTFNLDFVPKHILLTYNAEIPEDSILRFAVTGFDTVDLNEYQYIEPNKIENLSSLSLLSKKFKAMVEMFGHSGVPIKVNEFALMFSGSANELLNDLSSSSSSSSFSSGLTQSSESLSSNSSSSLDSSSSSSLSSVGYSTSSSLNYSSSSSYSSNSSSSSSSNSSGSSTSSTSSSSSLDYSTSSSSSSSKSSVSSSSTSSLGYTTSSSSSFYLYYGFKACSGSISPDYSDLYELVGEWDSKPFYANRARTLYIWWSGALNGWVVNDQYGYYGSPFYLNNSTDITINPYLPYNGSIGNGCVDDYIGTSSSSSLAPCPNDILSITSQINTGIAVTFDTNLALQKNGEAKNSQILLYTGGTTGVTYDHYSTFYGELRSGGGTFSTYLSIIINGLIYYLPIYTSDPPTLECTSNLIGIESNTGTFTAAGYILIVINAEPSILRFTPIYTKT